jgi:hypothetical protein
LIDVQKTTSLETWPLATENMMFLFDRDTEKEDWVVVEALGKTLCHFYEPAVTHQEVIERCIDGGITGMIQTGMVFLCGPTGTAGDVRAGIGGVFVVIGSLDLLRALLAWFVDVDATLLFSRDNVTPALVGLLR